MAISTGLFFSVTAKSLRSGLAELRRLSIFNSKAGEVDVLTLLTAFSSSCYFFVQEYLLLATRIGILYYQKYVLNTPLK